MPPLTIAMEDWACSGAAPPDSRMFTLDKTDNPSAKHLPSEPAEIPVTDELGIAKGGVRLPPVEVPMVRYSSAKGESPKAAPLEPAELTRRYGTPDNYRRLVSETVDRLIRDRFLPESARTKFVADAEKVNW